MKLPILTVFSLLIVTLLLYSCDRDREFSDQLIQRIKADSSLDGEFEGDLIFNLETIQALYEEENQILLPKWGNIDKVNEMLFVIRNISADGLHPQDYHLNSIETQVEKVFRGGEANIEDRVKLELLLTDAYLLITTHLAAGKIDQERVDPKWKAAKRTPRHNLEKFVDSTIVHDQIIESILSLTPNHREYKNLKKGLANYRSIATNGGWGNFELTLPKLERGMSHPDVAKLRNRLSRERELSTLASDENVFDDGLYESVIEFQNLHGLTPDGVVGKGTAEALNVSVEDRIAAIEANMERWRWLSDNLGDRYIQVNIANYEMQVVENDQPVLISRAIVGRPYRQTPVFSAVMNHLVLAPTWTVPPGILWQDVIPAVKKNPAYLSQKKMQLLRSNGSVVDPSTIDWKNVTRSNFPYTVRQVPGKDNALGGVKFMFPNPYHVYIHDTPTRDLFAQTDRTFSSGCIRISKPMELADYLLRDKPEWTADQINRTIAQGKERAIYLSNPIQVHILYLTTWAEDDGTMHFRKDVYNRDQPLLAALKQAPPTEAIVIAPSL
jgi:L,D-transpeptidase YcbB